jgi:phosphoglycolate phosphatase
MMLFFDFDGTIIDISQKYFCVYSDFVRMHGGTALTQRLYWELKRSETSDKEILDASHLPDLDPDLLRRHIRNNIELEQFLQNDQLFDDAAAILDRLSSSYKCYLISMRRNRPMLQKQLRWLNIERFFTAVLTPIISVEEGGEAMLSSKAAALERLGITSPSLIVGDSGLDIMTGKKLRIATCAVTTGIRNESILKKYEPDFIAGNLLDLDAIVRRLESVVSG